LANGIGFDDMDQAGSSTASTVVLFALKRAVESPDQSGIRKNECHRAKKQAKKTPGGMKI